MLFSSAVFAGFSSLTGSKTPAQKYTINALQTYSKWDDAVGELPIQQHEEIFDPSTIAGRHGDEIVYVYKAGHMDGESDDLHVATMTVPEAKKWCSENTECHGFSMEGSDKVSMWFS